MTRLSLALATGLVLVALGTPAAGALCPNGMVDD